MWKEKKYYHFLPPFFPVFLPAAVSGFSTLGLTFD
jgi:hypothetical protein